MADADASQGSPIAMTQPSGGKGSPSGASKASPAKGVKGSSSPLKVALPHVKVLEDPLNNCSDQQYVALSRMNERCRMSLAAMLGRQVALRAGPRPPPDAPRAAPCAAVPCAGMRSGAAPPSHPPPHPPPHRAKVRDAFSAYTKVTEARLDSNALPLDLTDANMMREARDLMDELLSNERSMVHFMFNALQQLNPPKNELFQIISLDAPPVVPVLPKSPGSAPPPPAPKKKSPVKKPAKKAGKPVKSGKKSGKKQSGKKSGKKSVAK
eukprot:gene15190-16477_t